MYNRPCFPEIHVSKKALKKSKTTCHKHTILDQAVNDNECELCFALFKKGNECGLCFALLVQGNVLLLGLIASSSHRSE